MASRLLNLLILLSALLATACTRSDEAQPEPQTEPDTGETVSEAAPQLDELLPPQFTGLTRAWHGDLDGMAERRVVRTLVVTGGPQFFYSEGRPRGMIAELLERLQEQLNQDLQRGLDQVEVVPMPSSRDRLVEALVNGQADLVAADLTVTEARSAVADHSVALVENVDEIIVFAPGYGTDVEDLDDLSGKTVYVRRSSSYYEHLTELNARFEDRGREPIRIDAANEYLRTQDILEMVDAGMVAATVIDNYKATYWSEIFSAMQVRRDLVLHSGGEIAWFFRKDSPQLAAAVNKFIENHRPGTLIGNVLIDRYMEHLDWVRDSTSDESIDRMRPLLEHFRSSAAENDFDPLMLAAQAFQESGLNHDRVSPSGAEGIMQIKPSTAADRNVGINDISTPAENIRAAARYMRFLIDRYFSDPRMAETDRWIFALAAYNAGPARIQRLRKMAASQGYDPDLWIDNVELVAAQEIGRETVRYVRNTFKYYIAYHMAWENRVFRQSLETG